jgi:hypothetical protein
MASHMHMPLRDAELLGSRIIGSTFVFSSKSPYD